MRAFQRNNGTNYKHICWPGDFRCLQWPSLFPPSHVLCCLLPLQRILPTNSVLDRTTEGDRVRTRCSPVRSYNSNGIEMTLLLIFLLILSQLRIRLFCNFDYFSYLQCFCRRFNKVHIYLVRYIRNNWSKITDWLALNAARSFWKQLFPTVSSVLICCSQVS